MKKLVFIFFVALLAISAHAESSTVIAEQTKISRQNRRVSRLRSRGLPKREKLVVLRATREALRYYEAGHALRFGNGHGVLQKVLRLFKKQGPAMLRKRISKRA